MIVPFSLSVLLTLHTVDNRHGFKRIIVETSC